MSIVQWSLRAVRSLLRCLQPTPTHPTHQLSIIRLAQLLFRLQSGAMNRMKLICLVALCLAPYPLFSQTAHPLRIFLRAGPKTHGPGQHDGPRWLAEWKPLLSSRGAKVDGAIGFPTAEQLENTDVLVMYSAEGGAIKPAQREYLDK